MEKTTQLFNFSRWKIFWLVLLEYAKHKKKNRKRNVPFNFEFGSIGNFFVNFDKQ